MYITQKVICKTLGKKRSVSSQLTEKKITHSQQLAMGRDGYTLKQKQSLAFLFFPKCGVQILGNLN